MCALAFTLGPSVARVNVQRKGMGMCEFDLGCRHIGAQNTWPFARHVASAEQAYIHPGGSHTCCKACPRVRLVCRVLVQLQLTPRVARKVLAVLTVHRIHLNRAAVMCTWYALVYVQAKVCACSCVSSSLNLTMQPLSQCRTRCRKLPKACK